MQRVPHTFDRFCPCGPSPHNISEAEINGEYHVMVFNEFRLDSSLIHIGWRVSWRDEEVANGGVSGRLSETGDRGIFSGQVRDKAKRDAVKAAAKHTHLRFLDGEDFDKTLYMGRVVLPTSAPSSTEDQAIALQSSMRYIQFVTEYALLRGSGFKPARQLPLQLRYNNDEAKRLSRLEDLMSFEWFSVTDPLTRALMEGQAREILSRPPVVWSLGVFRRLRDKDVAETSSRRLWGRFRRDVRNQYAFEDGGGYGDPPGKLSCIISYASRGNFIRRSLSCQSSHGVRHILDKLCDAGQGTVAAPPTGAPNVCGEPKWLTLER